MEVEGNVGVVLKMSQFRPKMDFNKVRNTLKSVNSDNVNVSPSPQACSILGIHPALKVSQLDSEDVNRKFINKCEMVIKH